MSDIQLLKAVVPEQPFLVLAVAFILAHCNLAAIWWVSSSTSMNTKSIAAAVAVGCLWLVLVQILQTTRENGQATLAWSAAIVSQVALTALAVMIFELSIDYKHAAARSRFSLRYLVIWTTLFAIALGLAGEAAGRSGFKLGDVPSWEFAAQLQGVAIANATLAIAIYTGIRLATTWRIRGLTAAILAVAGAVLAPLCLLAIFDDRIGAPVTDLVWLFGANALFLIPSTMYSVLSANPYTQPPTIGLKPEPYSEVMPHQSSAATSNGSSSLARLARS